MSDQKKHQELRNQSNQETGKTAELRKALAELKRRTPDPWNNAYPETPPHTEGVRRVAVNATRMDPTIQPRNL
eukprot:765221-Prorocentrum_lima.AAC.1